MAIDEFFSFFSHAFCFWLQGNICVVAACTEQWENPENAGCRVLWLDGTVTGSEEKTKEWKSIVLWYTTMDSNGSLVR